MISLEEVEKTILDLEARDTTYAVCERLAWLYIVRDHLAPAPSARYITTSQSSEFLTLAQEKDCSEVWDIIDEHMECVKLVFPKQYDMIIGKINAL